MWLFTQHGFFSVVCGRESGGSGSQIDPDVIMIRGRRRSEMQALRDRFDVLRDCDIAENGGTDYRYRMVVNKAAWQQVARALAEEIDYGNFKSRCAQTVGGAYEEALHRIWDIMWKHQQGEPNDAS